VVIRGIGSEPFDPDTDTDPERIAPVGRSMIFPANGLFSRAAFCVGLISFVGRAHDFTLNTL